MLLELMALARSEGPDKFVAAIKSRLSAGLQHPEIVALLYIDEAHELSSVTSGYSRYSLYDTFIEAFDLFASSRPIFLITISTNTSIRHSSSHTLCPPYTDLEFDCLLDNRPIFYPGRMTLRDVSKPAFMAKFGRPLCVRHSSTSTILHLCLVSHLDTRLPMSGVSWMSCETLFRLRSPNLRCITSIPILGSQCPQKPR